MSYHRVVDKTEPSLDSTEGLGVGQLRKLLDQKAIQLASDQIQLALEQTDLDTEKTIICLIRHGQVNLIILTFTNLALQNKQGPINLGIIKTKLTGIMPYQNLKTTQYH